MNTRVEPQCELDTVTDSPWLAAIEWTLTLATCAFQVFCVPHEIWGDGAVRFETMTKLVDSGVVSPERYSIMQSLLAIPLYFLGKLFQRGPLFASYFNVVVLYSTLFVLYRLLRRHLPTAVLRRTILILVAASMFGNHVQFFYGELLTACAAFIGVAALALNRPLLAGLAMVVAVENTPAAMLGLLLCNGWWALKTRRWIHAAWPLFVSGGLIALEFWWRRGSVFASGYSGTRGFKTFMPYSDRPDFSYPLLLGAVSLLFSFGRGILFYAPGLLLHHVPIREKRNTVSTTIAQLSIAFFWGMVLAYSRWWCWYGAWFWGQRFLLFACLPASFALARHVSTRGRTPFAVSVLTVAVVVWSAWVGINGTVIKEVETEPCMMNNFYWESICFYIPEFSPLIHPLIVPKALKFWDKIEVLLGAAVAFALIVPMLWSRIRDYAIRVLTLGGYQPKAG